MEHRHIILSHGGKHGGSRTILSGSPIPDDVRQHIPSELAPSEPRAHVPAVRTIQSSPAEAAGTRVEERVAPPDTAEPPNVPAAQSAAPPSPAPSAEPQAVVAQPAPVVLAPAAPVVVSPASEAGKMPMPKTKQEVQALPVADVRRVADQLGLQIKDGDPEAVVRVAVSRRLKLS